MKDAKSSMRLVSFSHQVLISRNHYNNASKEGFSWIMDREKDVRGL